MNEEPFGMWKSWTEPNNMAHSKEPEILLLDYIIVNDLVITENEIYNNVSSTNDSFIDISCLSLLLLTLTLTLPHSYTATLQICDSHSRAWQWRHFVKGLLSPHKWSNSRQLCCL